MEAATSAALLELAAPEAGTAAKSAAGAALPATVRKKRDRPTDWDPDRPLEKWQVGGLEFQNPSDGPVELRRQIEEAKEWIELSRRSEEQALRLKTAPGAAERMWPGITTRYVLRERRPCTPHSADGRRYLTVPRELELVENCVNLLRAKDNKGCAACKGRKRAHNVSSRVIEGHAGTCLTHGALRRSVGATNRAL